MSQPETLRLKQPSGWFAAGREWEAALYELSDGAFRLFAYLSLRADRRTGRLAFRQTPLARALGKSRRSIQTYLNELAQKGLCRILAGRNQHAAGTIEIAEAYWPYRRAEEGSPSAEAAYVAAVQKMFLAYPCVASRYPTQDQKLARKWHQEGVPLQAIEQALLLGCGRKYVSWLNGSDAEKIASLYYFHPILEELLAFNLSAQYQAFNRCQVERLQERWLAEQTSARDKQPRA